MFERSEFLATPEKVVFLEISDNVGGLFLWFCFFWANKRNERPAAAINICESNEEVFTLNQLLGLS
ncbi:hypothetical protein A9Q79_06425 [Methylophaga sp. 42_25_T18]|nr:hypothetical protein A9Q79_06425 [Methylophaga sp. 42_25_T18]OUR85966.1 hypothetical protein A9Q92_06855 [Methylophaga sp. 42_8_T64]